MRMYLAQTCQEASELSVRAGTWLYLIDPNLLKFKDRTRHGSINQ